MTRWEPTYKREPGKLAKELDGLPFELRGALSILLDLFNLRGGVLRVDEPQFIAGHLGMPTRRWKKVLGELVAVGALVVEGDLMRWGGAS